MHVGKIMAGLSGRQDPVASGDNRMVGAMDGDTVPVMTRDTLSLGNRGAGRPRNGGNRNG